jgi:acyl carrier protein
MSEKLRGPETVLEGREAVKFEKEIRDALIKYGSLPVGAADLGLDDDLYQAGLTSHASVNVMLALEDTYHVEFPDTLLKKETFQSISALNSALDSLGASSAEG